MTSDTRKRKEINSQARIMIAKVYHFLREEYRIMKENNFANCDLSPLANIRKRTAEATGVSERTVTQALKEERVAAMSNATERKRKKKNKKQTIKKKLRHSDDRKVAEKNENTSINVLPMESSERRLKPKISIQELAPADQHYNHIESETESNWMIRLRSPTTEFY